MAGRKRPERVEDHGQVGELGRVIHPDGSVSTELSIGVNVGGKEIVIPLLVKGNEHIAKALATGTFRDEMVGRREAETAVRRYHERVQAGALSAPGFETPEEASLLENRKAGTIARRRINAMNRLDPTAAARLRELERRLGERR